MTNTETLKAQIAALENNAIFASTVAGLRAELAALELAAIASEYVYLASIKYSGVCRDCSAGLYAGKGRGATAAWFHKASKSLCCLECKRALEAEHTANLLRTGY